MRRFERFMTLLGRYARAKAATAPARPCECPGCGASEESGCLSWCHGGMPYDEKRLQDIRQASNKEGKTNEH